MDIHVGMMLKFVTGNHIGWIIDDSPMIQYNIPGDIITYKVQWSSGAITYEVLKNIKTYRNKWLELEQAHERLSNKD
jgi:hypothetical protein